MHGTGPTTKNGPGAVTPSLEGGGCDYNPAALGDGDEGITNSVPVRAVW